VVALEGGMQNLQIGSSNCERRGSKKEAEKTNQGQLQDRDWSTVAQVVVVL